MDIKTMMLDAANIFIGCSCGMAATFLVHPLDVIKIRMQLNRDKTTTKSEISSILKNEKVPTLYLGLSANLFRQAAHTTTRLGVYTWMFDLASNNGYPNFWVQISLGTLAGCVSSFVWAPAELVFIRMAVDSSLPVGERRNYKNVLGAIIRITREEGFFRLWRGAVLTTNCTMIVNGVQIVSFIQALIILAKTEYFENSLSIWLSSFALSGLVTAALVTPIDIIKTRIQTMKTDGKSDYVDTIDVVNEIVSKEGLFTLWKGFIPHYARLVLHTALTTIFIEKMTFQQLPDFPFFNSFS